MRRRPRLAGNVLALGLMIAALLLTVAFALALLGTSNLNLANAEANRQKALEVARAGANQYMFDMQALRAPDADGPVDLLMMRPTFVRMAPPGTSSSFMMLPPGGQASYPLPQSHLKGKCYITFDRSNPHYSVDNTSSSTAADGWRGVGTVPPYSLDLIVTGAVNGVERHIEVVISKRWDYALTTPCPMDIGGARIGTQWVASRIDGDVFTGCDYSADQGAVINVGRCQPAPGVWEYSSENLINGYLRVRSKNESSVYVNNDQGQNGVAGTKFGSTEARYPSVTLPATDSWTNLADAFTYARRADHAGSWLSTWVNSRGETCYAVESDAESHEFRLPEGDYVVPGNLVGGGEDGSSSSARELVLDGASLRVSGNLQFESHPKRIYGNQAVLWVEKALTFHDGFLDGGTNGFVVYARSIDTRAGGSFKGLMLVQEELSMSPFDRSLSPGSDDAATYESLRTKSGAGGGRGMVVQDGDRHVAVMEIRGGVFTPRENIYAALYRALNGLPPLRFVLSSVCVTWDPKYLAALHQYADLKISYWQEIP